ncbi:hypothetical protein C8R46DRAFT_1093851 [Mycena filopes]|nr:hypothetical protein C8R46DRAFT_1093851 [Mycena filopes]
MRLAQCAQEIVGQEPLIDVFRGTPCLPIRLQRAFRRRRSRSGLDQRRFKEHRIGRTRQSRPSKGLERSLRRRRQRDLHHNGYALRVGKDGCDPLEVESRKRVGERQQCSLAALLQHADVRMGDVHIGSWRRRLLPSVDEPVELLVPVGQGIWKGGILGNDGRGWGGTARRRSRSRVGCRRSGGRIVGRRGRGRIMCERRWTVARSWGGLRRDCQQRQKSNRRTHTHFVRRLSGSS